MTSPVRPPSSEHARIALLTKLLGQKAPGFEVALGDDCAVLSPGTGGHLVWSIDAAVEGTHFRRDLMSLEDAGYRATMAALSDLAAMGASPLGIVSALVLPRALPDEDFEAIVRGQRAAAEDAGTSIVGGNLARGDAIAITTSVLGTAQRPILRSGARPGDAVLLAGSLGLSAAGLWLAQRSEDGADELRALALGAFRRPRARLADGIAAERAGATSLIDVSDGLAQDLGHLSLASEVTIVLEESAIVAATSSDVAARVGRDPVDLALRGGEDYALVATAPAGVAIPGFIQIGLCEQKGEDGVALERDGRRVELPPGGFDHFAPR